MQDLIVFRDKYTAAATGLLLYLQATQYLTYPIATNVPREP